MSNNLDTLKTNNFVLTIGHHSLSDKDKENIQLSCKVVNVDLTNLQGTIVDAGFIRYEDMKLWTLLKRLKDNCDTIRLTVSTKNDLGDIAEVVIDQSCSVIAMSLGHQCGNPESSSFFVKFGDQGVVVDG